MTESFQPKVGDLVELRTVVRLTSVSEDRVQYEPVFEGGWAEREYVGPITDKDPRLDFSEMDDREFKPEGADVNENLGRAFLIYQERVANLLEPFTDEQLKAFAVGVKEGYSRWVYDEFPKTEALKIVMYRELARIAKPVLDSGDSYCVSHGCGFKVCGDLHKDEE